MQSPRIATAVLVAGLLCTVFVQAAVGAEAQGPRPSEYLRSMQRNISHRHDGKVELVPGNWALV